MSAAHQSMESGISPLVRHRIKVPNSSIEFSAACFGGDGKERSLAPLQKPEDVAKHPDLAQLVGLSLQALGAKEAFAPKPTEFNGVILTRRVLTDRLEVIPRLFVNRNAALPGDGTFLRASGDAGIFSAAGCSVIVATDGKDLVFAHAGHLCLIDRERVISGNNRRSRPHMSVVDNIVRALGSNPGGACRHIRAWVFYSIKPEDFDLPFKHPGHGEYNRAVAEYLPRRYGPECTKQDEHAVYLDLPKIARAQFEVYGIPREQISLEHAYLADELPTTRNSNGARYLVAIVLH